MTKAELVSHIAEKSNVTKRVADAVLKSLIGSVHRALKEEGQLRIDGLGTFKVTERKARTGVNPRTGAKITIPASRAAKFSAAKALKEATKGPVKKVEKKPEKRKK